MSSTPPSYISGDSDIYLPQAASNSAMTVEKVRPLSSLPQAERAVSLRNGAIAGVFSPLFD
jgi:hypothetical protein